MTLVAAPQRRAAEGGFSLLEVMISVLVLAIGLLGLSALQAQGLRGGTSAHQRAQATLLAYDMMERLRADFPKAIAGDYNRAIGAALPEDADFQANEITDWVQSVARLLPAGDGAVACDNVGTCTVTVQWDDSRGGNNGEGGDAEQQFVFTTQI
jgi:type IV pilus assembly protein PilV